MLRHANTRQTWLQALVSGHHLITCPCPFVQHYEDGSGNGSQGTVPPACDPGYGMSRIAAQYARRRCPNSDWRGWNRLCIFHEDNAPRKVTAEAAAVPAGRRRCQSQANPGAGFASIAVFWPASRPILFVGRGREPHESAHPYPCAHPSF